MSTSLPSPTRTPNPARLATLDQTARHANRDTRTIRRWLARGEFGAYESPSGQGLLFDLDEVDEALARLRRTKYGSYGPKAVIRPLPRRAVVVTENDK